MSRIYTVLLSNILTLLMLIQMTRTLMEIVFIVVMDDLLYFLIPNPHILLISPLLSHLTLTYSLHITHLDLKFPQIWTLTQLWKQFNNAKLEVEFYEIFRIGQIESLLAFQALTLQSLQHHSALVWVLQTLRVLPKYHGLKEKPNSMGKEKTRARSYFYNFN